MLPSRPKEMAFALAVFVAASEYSLLSAAQLYAALVRKEVSGPGPNPTRESPRLFPVFRALWAQFAGDPKQVAICARVVGFHLMMERTAGTAIDGWCVEEDGNQSRIALHSAVVQAIGRVPLSQRIAFPDKLFHQQIGMCAGLADSMS